MKRRTKKKDSERSAFSSPWYGPPKHYELLELGEDRFVPKCPRIKISNSRLKREVRQLVAEGKKTLAITKVQLAKGLSLIKAVQYIKKIARDEWFGH